MATEQTITGLEFRVRQTEGSAPERLVVDSDRVLIGSGAHCEIRLPPDQAAVEHVLISFLGGLVYAQARAFRPAPLLNGSPFTEAPLAPDAKLQIGPAEITVSIIEIEDAAAKIVHKKKEATNPLVYVLAAVAVPLSLYVLLDPGSGGPGGAMPKQVPPLWEEAPPGCPQSAPDQALAVARDKRIVAMGKRERSPFEVRDGVAAVPLFFLSADCYRVAGHAEVAAEMRQAGERLERQMEEGYRAHRVRLEHCLEVKDLRNAHREVKTLLSMMQGRTGPWLVWLSNLDRQLQLKLGKERKR